MWYHALTGMKVAVAAYWVLVAKALLMGTGSAFDAILVMSAPLIVSFHFIQALVLLRRVRSSEPYWLQLGQTLLFGALYIAPLLLRQTAAREASPADPRARRSR